MLRRPDLQDLLETRVILDLVVLLGPRRPREQRDQLECKGILVIQVPWCNRTHRSYRTPRNNRVYRSNWIYWSNRRFWVYWTHRTNRVSRFYGTYRTDWDYRSNRIYRIYRTNGTRANRSRRTCGTHWSCS